jgi:hypothetical protein
MNKTKAIVLLIAASVLIAAMAGIAFAQYANAQTNGNNSANQIPLGTTNINSPSPQQGYYSYSAPTQNGYPYGYRMGMGMCGRYW